MRPKIGFLFAALLGACATGVASEPTPASELMFAATLRGDMAPTATGSRATGAARIAVDSEAQTVDLTLEVSGISIDQLWDRLVQAPIGPIHFHIYAANGDVSLILPAPFGQAYAATEDGFRVTMRDYPYAQGAALLNSEASFEAFVTGLDSGAVVLNIHTDAHQDGEISGLVVREEE